ncbi:MAG: response regulator transcription factor [Caldilineaceae bacterium]|nr:response regulator transcription factor [Caldilineaceae bacterium]
MIHILLVDKVRLVSELVGVALQGEPDIQVAGCAYSREEALQQLETLECDIVLINRTLADRDVLALIEEIRRRAYDVRVLVMGLPETEALILRYIEAGASGYIVQSDSIHDLLFNVRAIAAEQAVVSPKVAAMLIDRVAELTNRLANLGVDVADYDGLTAREKEILALIASELTNQEIADRLLIEVGTVKNHVHNILSKLHVHSRQDAAAYFALIQASQPRHRTGDQPLQAARESV